MYLSYCNNYQILYSLFHLENIFSRKIWKTMTKKYPFFPFLVFDVMYSFRVMMFLLFKRKCIPFKCAHQCQSGYLVSTLEVKICQIFAKTEHTAQTAESAVSELDDSMYNSTECLEFHSYMADSTHVKQRLEESLGEFWNRPEIHHHEEK